MSGPPASFVPTIGTRDWPAMSCVAVAVGAEHAAIAADSIFVDVLTGSWQSGHSKVVQVGERIAALCGVANVNGVPLLPILARALSTAPTTSEVPTVFISVAGTLLSDGWKMWHERFTDDNFLSLIVAGREPRGGVDAFELVPQRSAAGVSFMQQRLGVDGSEAFCGVYGVCDDELARYTSAYRYRHQAAMLNREFLPAPLLLGAHASAVSLVDHCREGVQSLCAREQMLSRPRGWPSGTPVVAAPTLAVSI